MIAYLPCLLPATGWSQIVSEGFAKRRHEPLLQFCDSPDAVLRAATHWWPGRPTGPGNGPMAEPLCPEFLPRHPSVGVERPRRETDSWRIPQSLAALGAPLVTSS